MLDRRTAYKLIAEEASKIQQPVVSDRTELDDTIEYVQGHSALTLDEIEVAKRSGIFAKQRVNTDEA